LVLNAIIKAADQITEAGMESTQKRVMTAEDLYRFQHISGARIDPQGEKIVFAVQRVDQKTEKKYTNLWMTSVSNGIADRFTFGDHNDSRPKWSPDGSKLAFLSNRGDKDKPAQIYVIPMAGGEARPLTSLKGNINDFHWSPDGSKLLCTIRKSDPEEIERQEDEQKKKLGVVHRYYERVFYKLDGFGYLPKERQHLWIVDAVSGEADQITDHPVFDERDPAWSPDGKSITFVSNRQDEPDFFPIAWTCMSYLPLVVTCEELRRPLEEKDFHLFLLMGPGWPILGRSGKIRATKMTAFGLSLLMALHHR
jgi:dipeptidyl aminopeptidase/acylaminoacyl peptidase